MKSHKITTIINSVAIVIIAIALLMSVLKERLLETRTVRITFPSALLDNFPAEIQCVEDQECPDCEAKRQIVETRVVGRCTKVKCDSCGSEFALTPFGVERVQK